MCLKQALIKVKYNLKNLVQMIEIDGSHEEGGGSILRQAIGLSLYTGKAFRITNIRANRPKPGLSVQHLKSLELAQKISNSKVTGMHLGSTTVEFIPKKLSGGKNVKLDIGTAGSITLLLQSVLIPCLFSPYRFRFKLTGGTDVKWSPPIDFFDRILIPELRKIAPVEFRTLRRGYYPKGNGQIELKIGEQIQTKNKPNPIQMYETGTIQSIQGVCHASKELQEEKIVEQILEPTKILLGSQTPNINIRMSYSATSSPGATLFVYAVIEHKTFEGPVFYKVTANGLYNPEKKPQDTTPEQLAEEVSNKLIDNIDSHAPVDEWLGDQLIPLMAILGGKIKVPNITKHMKSNMKVCEMFFDKKFKVGDNGVIEV